MGLCMGIWVQGLGPKVSHLGCRVQGSKLLKGCLLGGFLGESSIGRWPLGV